MQTSVAIVGGGLSGLYAALCLQGAGIDFQLLEARERFGGRILSVDAGGKNFIETVWGRGYVLRENAPAMGEEIRESA